MPAPCRALATSVRAQKCGMVMSVTTQIIFPYMSDARTPAMDVQMTAQDVGMLRSFSVSLSAMLIGDDGYVRLMSLKWKLRVDVTTQPGRPQAAEGRMFVTYPQSGNGQRQVMSDHRRNMFLSFHLVVVSRDPRARGLSLSLSSHRLAKQYVASFRWLLSFSRPPSSKERACFAVRTAMSRARCSVAPLRSCLL